jgi:hypothetical protein
MLTANASAACEPPLSMIRLRGIPGLLTRFAVLTVLFPLLVFCRIFLKFCCLFFLSILTQLRWYEISQWLPIDASHVSIIAAATDSSREKMYSYFYDATMGYEPDASKPRYKRIYSFLESFHSGLQVDETKTSLLRRVSLSNQQKG